MFPKIKKRTYEILEIAKEGDYVSKIFDIFILSLIFLNIVFIILESVESLYKKYEFFFWLFDVFTVSIFTVEYVLRLWSCTTDERYKEPLKGRIRFALTPMAVIDLLAILPFFLTFLNLDLRILRAIRLFRLLRVLKMGRYFTALRILGNVFIQKKEELIVSIFFVIILLIIASTLMYYIENEAQPDVFSSIPATMWWSIATLTTVGYGDMYPITPLGRLLGGIIAILGIGLFSLPAGIVASGFVEEYQNKNKKKTLLCPHCGKNIYDNKKNIDGQGD